MPLRALMVFGLVLVTAGCAEFTYDILGRGGWPHEQDGLYSRLGGAAGVRQIADGWVDNGAGDPRLARYFTGVDLPGFKASLAQRLCTATAGPCVYTGRGLTDVHAPMVIDEAAFDAFMDDLRNSLDANHIQAADQQRLIDILSPMRESIVSVQS